MELVIDANILFAVLIKESITADLIIRNDLQLYAPKFILEELSKFQTEILNKTNRDLDSFHHYLAIIERKLNFIDYEDFEPFLIEAEKVSPDIKDSPYFAVAMLRNIGIWSNDKKICNQNRVKIYSTRDIVELLGL